MACFFCLYSAGVMYLISIIVLLFHTYKINNSRFLLLDSSAEVNFSNFTGFVL